MRAAGAIGQRGARDGSHDRLSLRNAEVAAAMGTTPALARHNSGLLKLLLASGRVANG